MNAVMIEILLWQTFWVQLRSVGSFVMALHCWPPSVVAYRPRCASAWTVLVVVVAGCATTMMKLWCCSQFLGVPAMWSKGRLHQSLGATTSRLPLHQPGLKHPVRHWREARTLPSAQTPLASLCQSDGCMPCTHPVATPTTPWGRHGAVHRRTTGGVLARECSEQRGSVS